MQGNSGETVRLAAKPLIELAIGSLGDLSGDLGYIRHQLTEMKNKEIWTKRELDLLKKSLTQVASMFNKTIEEWEEQTDVRLP